MNTEKGHNGKSKLTSFHVTSIRIFFKKEECLDQSDFVYPGNIMQYLDQTDT